MDSPDPPTPPDPAVTTAAQTASNKETAQTQQELNQTNQVTPNGSLTYSQIGTWADGTPRYQSTQTLSPDQQNLSDLNNRTKANIGQIGVDQSSRIAGLLGTPVQSLDLGPGFSGTFNANSAIEDKIDALGRTRLDPQWQQNQSALDAKLINQGIAPGSEQWNSAQTQFGQQKNDAYNSLYLNGNGQAQQAGLNEYNAALQAFQANQNQKLQQYQGDITSRNQPINEISALLSGSQVAQPSFSSTPSAGVAPTDIIGANNAAYQGQLSAYNTQSQAANSFNQGLFGLGSAVVGGGAKIWATSDIDAKENIDVVGQREDGLHVIDFDYKPGIADEGRHRGLIAQEVAKVYPHATGRMRSGLMAVDYAAIPHNRGLMGLGMKKAA